MDSAKEKALIKYILLGGALGISYFIIQFLSRQKKSKSKPLPLDKTTKVLQQIKYQMLTTCLNYAEAVNMKQSSTYSQQDLEIAFRTELAKICEAREDAVLNKYEIGRQEYASSLEAYKKNQIIKKEQSNIFEMMERAVKGTIPDLRVPTAASNHLSKENVLKVYLEMCELIAVRLWQKLEENKRNNPGFNSKDDAHYKKAVKQLSIYDVKAQFLERKGFKIEWGNPNEVFYKIMETIKHQDKEIKAKATKVQKAYEKTIESITNEHQNFNAERIKFMMEEMIGEPKEVPIKQSSTQARVLPSVSGSLSKPGKPEMKPQKKEEEFDFGMDDLMMKELLSRSEQSVAEKPVVIPAKIQEPKIVSNQSSQPEKKVESQPEPVKNIAQEPKQKHEEAKEDSKENENKEKGEQEIKEAVVTNIEEEVKEEKEQKKGEEEQKTEEKEQNKEEEVKEVKEEKIEEIGVVEGSEKTNLEQKKEEAPSQFAENATVEIKQAQPEPAQSSEGANVQSQPKKDNEEQKVEVQEVVNEYAEEKKQQVQ